MPYDPNKCTYSLGALRQQVYACLTCYERTNEMAGVCYSCSIQCHADHDIVELFTKRNFICDCGTTRMKYECNLRSKVNDDLPSTTNEYNHNFKGKFCDCARDYNPIEETGNMLQCILGDACGEDWFHDYCIMGLPKFKREKKENDGVNLLDTLDEPKLGESSKDSKEEKEEEELNDECEIAIDGFPRFENFDCFICWKCVEKNKDIFDLIKNDELIVEDSLQRIISDSLNDRNEQLVKKRKTDIYSLFLKENHESNFTKFLLDSKGSPNFNKIKTFFINFPYLLKDYKIYEPPEDIEDDDNSSIYDMGSKAINSLPREQAIQGVEAYQQIKEKLKIFLTPFAKDGKVVNKDDIETFFSALKENK